MNVALFEECFFFSKDIKKQVKNTMLLSIACRNGFFMLKYGCWMLTKVLNRVVTITESYIILKDYFI